MPAQRTTRLGLKDLDPVYYRALPGIDAQLKLGTPHTLQSPHIGVWRGLSAELLLVAFHNGATFPPPVMMEREGFARAIGHYAIIAADRGFTPTDNYDERWRSVLSLKLARPAAFKGRFDIPALGNDGLFKNDPMTTVEWLFRDHTVRAESDADWACTAAPDSDELKLFRLFSVEGSPLRSPVGKLVVTGPNSIDNDSGVLSSSKKKAPRRRKSAAKVLDSTENAGTASTLSKPTSPQNPLKRRREQSVNEDLDKNRDAPDASEPKKRRKIVTASPAAVTQVSVKSAIGRKQNGTGRPRGRPRKSTTTTLEPAISFTPTAVLVEETDVVDVSPESSAERFSSPISTVASSSSSTAVNSHTSSTTRSMASPDSSLSAKVADVKSAHPEGLRRSSRPPKAKKRMY